jgi:hypothetical protein
MQKSKAQRKSSHQQCMDSARDIHHAKDFDDTTNHSTMVEKT